MYQIYHAQLNPANLVDEVGGAISSSLVSGYVGELFQYISAPPSGSETSEYQYRKVFIKNTYAGISSQTRVWIEALEHSGQVHIALATSSVETTEDGTTAPPYVTGWVDPQNYSEGLDLGTISPGSSKGIWLKQTLSGVSEADPYVSFRISVGGILP